MTLLETAVVAALTGVILAVVVRWTISLLLLTGAGADAGSTARYAAVAQVDFTADTAAAAVCDPYGIGAAVVSLTDDEIRLTVDSDDDGVGDLLVAWAVVDSTLRRGISAAGDCTGAGIAWTVVADEVASPATGASYFSPVVDGEELAGPHDYDCSSAPTTCAFDALAMRVTLLRDGEDPTRVRVVNPLNVSNTL